MAAILDLIKTGTQGRFDYRDKAVQDTIFIQACHVSQQYFQCIVARIKLCFAIQRTIGGDFFQNSRNFFTFGYRHDIN